MDLEKKYFPTVQKLCKLMELAVREIGKTCCGGGP